MARGDPYWLFAKFTSGKCLKKDCPHQHKKGERIFYYPLARGAYCETHGRDAEADFRSHSESDVW